MPRPPGPARPLDDDDEEMDLPPVDADRDEQTIGPLDEVEDPIAALDDEGGLDDASASDLDVGAELDDDDGEGAEGDDEREIDVGSLDADLFDNAFGASADERIEGLGGDDDDLAEDADDRVAPGPLEDGGAEGTSDPIEDDVDDAELPELDADEHGDFEGDELLGEPLADGSDDAAPWVAEEERWAARDGAGAAVPCSAVAAAGGRVVAAGDVLLVVDEGAHAARRAPLGARPAAAGSAPLDARPAVAVGDGVLLFAPRRGAVLASTDFGASAAPVHGWRGRPQAAEPAVSEVAVTPGRAWILCDDGTLWVLPAPPATGAAAPSRDGVVAVVADGGGVVALSSREGGPTIERLRSDDEGWLTARLDADAGAVASSVHARLAVTAGGRAVAIGAPARGIAVSREGGASFRQVPLQGVVDSAFAGDGADAPLVALVAHDGGAHLVRLLEDGETRRVAEVVVPSADGDDDAPLGPASIAWDAARELVWVASRLGLVGYGPARRH